MNNDEKHIESLIDLFMQGESTLEQERELRTFFASSHSIPDKWEPYREMMAYFEDGMPIEMETNQRRNLARPVCALVAAAAVTATIIMVVPSMFRSPQTETPITKQALTAADDTVNNNDNRSIVQPKPVVAKFEKEKVDKIQFGQKSPERRRKQRNKASLDAVEIEREKGEVEQAQQELMADKFIIEQERQEVIDEQYAGRAQAYQTRQAFNNENPQFIQVVFK